MTLRKIIFWIHLPLGISAGLIIFVLAVTGALLAFQPQFVQRAERRETAFVVPATPRLSLDKLVEAAGTEISGISVFSDPAAALIVQAKGKGSYVNPYSGESFGDAVRGTFDFFKKVESVHRWFALENIARETAHQVKGAANICFLFMILSGFYLWWPKSWKAAMLLPKGGLKGKIRDFNWHNAFGILALPVLLVISTTGLVMSYGWASDMLYRATGNEVPPRPQAPGMREGAVKAGETAEPGKKEQGNHGKGARKAKQAHRVSLDALVAAAQAQAPEWKRIDLRMPKPGSASMTVNIQYLDCPPPFGRGTLTLDMATAKALKWEPYEEQNAGRKLKMLSRWSHTGQAFGLVGQILVFLACLAALIQVYTGLALAWRRFFKPS